MDGVDNMVRYQATGYNTHISLNFNGLASENSELPLVFVLIRITSCVKIRKLAFVNFWIPCDCFVNVNVNVR